MSEIEMTSTMSVRLVRTNANDEFPIQMAQASLGEGDEWEIDPKIDPQRFLSALVSPRHGVPFEHDQWTFFVEVPIFAARQWVKHRHASMNEMSGRYVQMIPRFYAAETYRPLVNTGTKMKPEFNGFDEDAFNVAHETDHEIAYKAWEVYQQRLEAGIAEEYARIVLPQSTFTQFYWTVNTRALMGFLERRVDSPDNRVETHPQWEIDRMARVVEDWFRDYMPLTHSAFVAAGRVAP